MGTDQYEGGNCPCCGEARREYYVFRLWTCPRCDSWLVGVGHSAPVDGGGIGWTGLGRYPLGPLDDVVESVGALVKRALQGDLRAVRELWTTPME